MTEALALLPPVINQSIQRVPLDPWSAAGFVGIVLASAYLAFRGSPQMAALLAFTVPFAAYRDVAQTTLTVGKCVALGTAAGLLLGGAPPWPRSVGTRRVLLASFLVLAAIAVSSIDAAYPMRVAREWFKQAEYAVLLWCAATFVERVPKSPRYFTGGVAAAGAIVATFAVWQAVIGGAPSAVLINGHAIPRATGMLEGPNQLAGFLEAVLPVMWVWPLLDFRFAPLRSYVVFASAAALVLSQSRAGIAVVLLAYAAFWRWCRTAAKATAVPAIAGAVAGLALTTGWYVLWAHASWADVWHMFLLDIPGQAAGGVGTRAQLWPAAIAIFLKHPIIGAGAGNFELLLPSVGLAGVQTNAASLPLQTLAEQGVIGFTALVIFASVALRETFTLRAAPLALAAFIAFASLLTHQLVDDLFFFPKVAALSFLLLGAGTASSVLAQHGGRAVAGKGGPTGGS